MPSQAVEVTVDVLGGATIQSASARVLSGEIHVHNTFDQPETVKPVPMAVQASGSVLKMTLPAAGVAAVTLRLN